MIFTSATRTCVLIAAVAFTEASPVNDIRNGNSIPSIFNQNPPSCEPGVVFGNPNQCINPLPGVSLSTAKVPETPILPDPPASVDVSQYQSFNQRTVYGTRSVSGYGLCPPTGTTGPDGSCALKKETWTHNFTTEVNGGFSLNVEFNAEATCPFARVKDYSFMKDGHVANATLLEIWDDVQSASDPDFQTRIQREATELTQSVSNTWTSKFNTDIAEVFMIKGTELDPANLLSETISVDKRMLPNIELPGDQTANPISIFGLLPLLGVATAVNYGALKVPPEQVGLKSFVGALCGLVWVIGVLLIQNARTLKQRIPGIAATGKFLAILLLLPLKAIAWPINTAIAALEDRKPPTTTELFEGTQVVGSGQGHDTQNAPEMAGAFPGPNQASPANQAIGSNSQPGNTRGASSGNLATSSTDSQAEAAMQPLLADWEQTKKVIDDFHRRAIQAQCLAYGRDPDVRLSGPSS